MKKIMTIFGAILFASVMMTSCGGKKAKDIDVEKLSSACEIVDAYLIVVNEMLDLSKEWDKLDENNGSEKRQDEIEGIVDNELSKIMDKIDKKTASLGIEEDEIKKCKNFKELERKLEEFWDAW
jgi:hypothetical protein